MKTVGCVIKSLPAASRSIAAQRAVEINPLNADAPSARRRTAGGLDVQTAALSLVVGRYWGAAGVRLTVGFMDNPPADLRARILSHMNAWSNHCNVQFAEIASSSDADVRIARVVGGENGGYWSWLGTDIQEVPRNEATMNLEGFTMNTPDSEFYRVVRHETGHTLGFPHEHLRAEIVNRMDREKTIEYFMERTGWSREEVIFQVLDPVPSSALVATAQADVNSIMCYWLPGSIMKDGVAVPGGTDIDALDARFAASVYPREVRPAGGSSGKAYFFKGNQYLRYDIKADKTDPGYPRPIAGAWPGFPASFNAGVDADLAWNNGKVYFFKGSQYIRYDVAADRVDPGYPKPIAGIWRGLWTDNIDAAMTWPNGKAYFFKGNQYIRYDIATNKADPGYPKLIAAGWRGLPASFNAGLQAAVTWPNGKSYLFKGNQYVRYDIKTDRADPGYPKLITAGWPGFWSQDLDA